MEVVRTKEWPLQRIQPYKKGDMSILGIRSTLESEAVRKMDHHPPSKSVPEPQHHILFAPNKQWSKPTLLSVLLRASSTTSNITLWCGDLSFAYYVALVH